MKILEKNIENIKTLCRQYKVKNLYAFGSILTNKFREDSDIDLLVNFQKDAIPISVYADNFFDFMYSLENLLGRKIDLICDDAIRNPFFRIEVDETKKIIYGEASN